MGRDWQSHADARYGLPMIATPAWPPRSTPRLFVDAPLAVGTDVPLDSAAAHYLRHVMRLTDGAPLLLCDDISGEWLARLQHDGKRGARAVAEQLLRPREAVPDIWLCFAPVKKAQLDWLVEKATELGAARLVPVITERTIVDRVNLDRLGSIAREAAEQCGRTALPALAAPIKLPNLLADWPPDRALLFADELGGDPALAACSAAASPAAWLTGPEGGFTDRERALIIAHRAVRRVSLGPRILRAETAALAALALWMGAQANCPEKLAN
jgi:16S rRNA (uracil1498-N3)-methyltransferase